MPRGSAHGLVAGEDAPGVGFVCTWMDARKCGGTCLAGRGGEPGNNIGAVGVRFQQSQEPPTVRGEARPMPAQLATWHSACSLVEHGRSGVQVAVSSEAMLGVEQKVFCWGVAKCCEHGLRNVGN